MKQVFQNSAWSVRDVRWVGSAQALTFLAGEVVLVVLLLHAYAAGWGSPGTALLLVTAALPLAVGGVLAGPLVDRVPSRVLAPAAAGWQGAVVLLTAAGAWWGAPGWTLVVGLLLVQVGQAVVGPTFAALLPGLVPPQRLPATLGAVQALVMVLGMLGPVVAGVATATGGVALGLGVAGAAFLAVALLALGVRSTRGGGTGGAGAGVLDGARFVRREPVVRAFVVGFVAFVLAVELVGVVLVFLVRDDLGGGELAYGVIGSVMLVGLVLGNLLAGRLSPGRRLVRATVVGAAGMAACLVLGGLAPGLVALGAAMVLLGVANGVLNVGAQTTLALRTPAEERGRVLGTVTAALRTASVVGVVAGGLVGTVLGPREVVVGAGVLGLLVAAWLWRALWRREDLDERAAAAVPAVVPAVVPAGNDLAA